MSGARLEFQNPIEDSISKLKFSPESNNLLIASWDSYLRLYNVESSSLILQLYSRAALLDCCFENESTSYTSGSDGFIQRYDLNAGTVDRIGRHDGIATSVLYSLDKGEVISTGLDKKIKFWDTRRGQSLVLSTDAGAPVRCITVNGNNLVVCVAASMHIYDLRSLDRPFQSYESQVEVPIRCLTSVPFSTAGYAVGSVDGQVALDFPNTACSSEMKYTFRCHPKSMKGRLHGACINAIEFTPGGSGTFVTGDNEGYVISWNAKSRRRLFELPKYSNSVASLAFNHTGELLAVASSHTYQEANEKEEPPQVFIHKF
ncbi:mitotic checkpoint protein BUB3.3 isoform X1 [Brassica rapa]|uniref:mitotic checkpoint protein BUB3.3 isoform X1 n=1 Tax=Brassica campestris TaxID=3711 RepID=UPI0004F1BF08|nr:mitotic checkpoint protein BUB3.3 isoform X1 [Brassica rapa]XP_048615961.1 mitotic checkpoint protein BUB3.3-like isoform X1 [Brassica napus]